MANIFGVMGSSIVSTGSGSSAGPDGYQGVKTFQYLITGSGNITSTCLIQGSDHPAPSVDGHWVSVATITLSGSSAVSDGFASEAPWRFYRYNVTAMSNVNTVGTVYFGTNAR